MKKLLIVFLLLAGPAVAGTLATDNFNRSDAATLGANWTKNGNQFTQRFQVVSNQAKIVTASGDAGEYYSAIEWPDDQWSQATLVQNDVYCDQCGLGVAVRGTRINSNANGYFAVVAPNGSPQVNIFKYVDGNYTQITTRTQAFSDGDILKLEVQGSTLKVYRNGVQLGADITDNSITEGSPGIVFGGFWDQVPALLEDWSGGDFSEDTSNGQPDFNTLQKTYWRN